MIHHRGITIDRKNQRISHNGKTKQFWIADMQSREARKFKAFVHLILQEHCREALFDRIYGHHEDGGPVSGFHILDVFFVQWKPVMDELSLRLWSEKRAGIMYYRLVPR